MSRFEGRTLRVNVFTFKEGVLSAAAHDLKLELTRAFVDVTDDVYTADFETSSVKVVTAMKDGAEQPQTLSPSLREEIERNIRNSVLDVSRFPTSHFRSTRVTPIAVEGQLTLHGITRPIRGTKRGDASAVFQLDQREFGIKPFTALLGTLKIKPVVTVTVDLLSA
jgi:hypothetical protein